MLVRPEAAARALDVLAVNGWTANKGFSLKYLRDHLHSVRSINLWKEETGDIDLHVRPFYAVNGAEADDVGFWSRAAPANLAGIPVLIPGPEDRLALALGVNGLEGYEHSDWLVDSAMLIASDRIDWPIFEQIVASRRLIIPAAIALHYLADELGYEIPRALLERLMAESVRHPAAFWLEFLLARPRYRGASPIGSAMRDLARHIRRRSEKRARGRGVPVRYLRARYLRRWKSDDRPPTRTECAFDIPSRRRPGERLGISAVVLLHVPDQRRRIELEINTEERHVCRVRYRKLAKGSGSILIGIDGALDLSDRKERLVLEARPSRHVRSLDSARHKARYSALPFHVVSLDLTLLPAEHGGQERLISGAVARLLASLARQR
jgi:hypothetical protein